MPAKAETLALRWMSIMRCPSFAPQSRAGQRLKRRMYLRIHGLNVEPLRTKPDQTLRHTRQFRQISVNLVEMICSDLRVNVVVVCCIVSHFADAQPLLGGYDNTMFFKEHQNCVFR